MSSIAAFSRRRRRNAIVITDFTPAELIWQDGPPSLASIGATTYSRALARNAAHQVLPPANQPTITYTSADTSKATINSSGVVTAVANGTSVITAASAGLTSITQTATVQQVAASVTVSPTTFSITDTGTQQLTATVKDANANTISGASVTWASDAPSTATVNSSGLVTGQGPGTVHITATSGGFSATSTGTISHVTYTLTATPNPVTGATGATVQLTVMEDTGSGPVDVTADSGTVYSTADKTKATIDAPTLTSVSPTTITQSTSGSYTFTGTNIKGTETIGGLPTGVTASAYSYTSTTVVCTLTATSGATVGAASVNLVSARGDSGTQTLTVNSAVSTPTLTSASPSALVQGTTNRLVTLTGTNFDTNCTAVFSNPGITVVSYGTITSTSLPVYITISGSATTGSGTVNVHQSGGGGLDSATKTFTVQVSGYPAQLTRAWEADSGLDVATNGAGVGTWTDQIGAATWTQTTGASKPVNANSALGGLNALQFSGAQTMTGTVAGSGLNGGAITIHVLCEIDVTDTSFRGILDNGDATAHSGFHFLKNDSTQWKADYGDGSAFELLITSTTSAGTWALLTLVLSSTSAGLNGGYVNGVLSGGGSLVYAPNTTVAPTLGTVPGDSPFKGKIAAIYVSGATSESSAQRTSVKTYVNSKWGTAF